MPVNNQKSNNTVDITNSFLKENDSKNLEDMKMNIQNLSMNDLLNLFTQYTDTKFYIKNKPDSLLNIIIDAILSKLNTMSLIKVIDLYIIFFNKSMYIEDTLMANKNILSVMSNRITNDEYIEKEIKKRKSTREKFILACKQDLEIYSDNISLNEKIYNYYENIQDKILLYIEININKLSSQENKFLFDNLNSRFEMSSKKLLDAIQSENSKGGFREIINYNEFKNSLIVYESFLETLLEKKKNDNTKVS